MVKDIVTNGDGLSKSFKKVNLAQSHMVYSKARCQFFFWFSCVVDNLIFLYISFSPDDRGLVGFVKGWPDLKKQAQALRRG